MDYIDNKYELFADYPDIVGLEDIREMLGTKNHRLGRTTTYKLIKNKTIPATKVAREYRIRKADIIKYLSKS